MIAIIKTAVITIIISIISGLFVEHLKSIGPKIFLNIEKSGSKEINNRIIYIYNITVKNMSKKIIHELTLNVQSPESSLELQDAEITKGLKFDSEITDNILDINIPFLSKNDNLKFTVYVQNPFGIDEEPHIVMRSPENFKRINSLEEGGLLSSFMNSKEKEETPCENKVEASASDNDYTMVMDKIPKERKSKKVHKKKGRKNNMKIAIAIASVIILVAAGALLKFYYKEAPVTSTKPASTKNDDKKTVKPADSAKDKDKKTNTNINNKAQNTNKSTGTETQNTNKDTPKQPIDTNKNADNTKKPDETTKSSDTKTSGDTTNQNKDTNNQGSTTTNPDTNNKSTGSDGNKGTGSTPGETPKDTGTNPGTGGTSGNTGK